jgi:secreted trypsin-like serine protease
MADILFSSLVDKFRAARSKGAMRLNLAVPVLAALAVLFLNAPAPTPAVALTGNAPPATGWVARPIVMVVDARGDLCTGTALARDLVLTAAHCVTLPIAYRVRTYQNDATIDVRSVARHPGFNIANYAASRATADVALIKLATPLPDIIVPAGLAAARRVAAGETLTIAGFGVTRNGTANGLGIPRMAALAVTGKPGSLQVRLQDPATRNASPGLGGCVGDSGAPVFDGIGPLVIGVVSWSTAPNDEEGCGGLTGVTPLINYRQWIVDTAKKFGSTVMP